MVRCTFFSFEGRIAMFDTSQAVKQVIGIQKGAFTGWYDAVANIQDQAVSAMDLMLDQTGVVPEEGRKAISSWLSACQQERSRLKSYMDTSFSNIEKFISKQTGK
jgi:prenyltransferase beta subunit